MELEDVFSELHALRKLYGLFQSSEDGLHASSINLDEKARLLLKNLLDCATERVFETHSKIIAAQSGVSNEPCATQPGEPEATPNLQPPVSPDKSNASPTVIQNSSKYLNFRIITSQKDEPSPTRPTHQGIVLEEFKPSIPVTISETRKKRCRVCAQSSMKQLNSGRETKIFNKKAQSPNEDGNDKDQRHADYLSHVHQVNEHIKGLEPKKRAIESLKSIEKPRQKIIRETQRNASIVRSLASSSSTLATGVVKPGGEHNMACEIDKKPEDADYVSKEVAKMIKRIESRLADVRLPTEVVNPLKEKNAAHQGLFMPTADTVGSIIQTKVGEVTRSELSQAPESVLVLNVLPRQHTNHRFRTIPANKVLSRSRKPFSVGIELPSQAARQKEEKALEFNDILSQPESQKGGKSKRTTQDSLLGQVSKPVARHELPSRKPTQVPGQNVKAVVKKLESLSRVTRQNDQVLSQTRNYVYGFRAAPSQDGLANGFPLHAKMPSQINKENRDQNPTAERETNWKVGTVRRSLLPQSDFVGPSRHTQALDPSRKLNRTRESRRENNLPRQITMSKTLYEDRRRSGVHKNIHEGPRNKILPLQQLSEGTTSSSRASSRWTTQQTTTSSSESEGDPPPRRTTRSGVVGPTSRRLRRGASDGSSAESRFSDGSESHYWDVEPTRRVCTTKSGPPVNRGMLIGRRLKRFKNKLGLIFHHHHHHHHHHDGDGEEDDSDSNHKKVDHTTSLWKYMRKIFHGKGNDKVYGDQAVENLRRSVVSSVPFKNQHGHFHALVEGLMRHTRHSKQSKLSKGGIVRLGKGQRKKVGKKMHWWQMFQRHRGVKLPRVKLGYTRKKRRD